MSGSVVTVTTDFGQADGYVATMKGVILGICPRVTLVDISHDIRPQAVQQAAYVLSTATPYFPAGAVHLVVVDPGVGTERRPIAVQTQKATYVAPDNGVLSLALRRDAPRSAIHLTQSAYRLPQVSATFHGRDIFAPAAAHLACGVDLREMGDPVPLEDLVHLPSFDPQRQPNGRWAGQVLHIDRFGNLVTNVQPPPSRRRSPTPDLQITVAGHQITGLGRTFSYVAPGELIAYVGSSGYLEIAVRGGNAATRLRIDVGDPVWVEGLP